MSTCTPVAAQPQADHAPTPAELPAQAPSAPDARNFWALEALDDLQHVQALVTARNALWPADGKPCTHPKLSEALNTGIRTIESRANVFAHRAAQAGEDTRLVNWLLQQPLQVRAGVLEGLV